MINYGKFLFAAPPRTGSTYFMKAAYVAGFGEGFKAHVHTLFPEEQIGTVLRLSMVRHPVDWLRSYYTAIYPGSCGIEEVDDLLTIPGDCFEEFAYNYVERMGNHLEHLFGAYQANSMLRIEDAPWGVIEMFDSLIPRMADSVRTSIRDLGPQNVSKELPRISKRTRRLIEEAEWPTMERYDY